MPVGECASLRFAAIDAEVGGLRRELESIGRELPLVESAGEADRFHAVIGAFHAEGGRLLGDLEKRGQAMRASLTMLAAYLGEEATPDEPEIVLGRIHAFVTSFCKACRDNERAAFLKHKAEQEEKERVERAKRVEEQGGPSAGGPASGGPAVGGGGGGWTPRRKMRVVQAPGVMSEIQLSVKRGEFKSMKALQAQMSEELRGKLGRRRSQMLDKDDD